MRKSIALVAALALVLSLFAGSVLALDAPATPSGNAKQVYANGVPVTIQADAPSGGTAVTLDGFTETGTSAYVVWTEGDGVKYVGVGAGAWIFGGAASSTAGADNRVSCATTSVLMNGGKVLGISGGGYGNSDVGAASVTVKGGSVDYIAGGGQAYPVVTSYADCDTNTETHNWVQNANVTIDGADGAISVVFGGGNSGYTYTARAVITQNGGEITELVGSGSNGKTGEVVINVNGGKADEVYSVNRGSVMTAKTTIGENANVKNVYVGSQSNPDQKVGSSGAVLSSAELSIAENATVANAYLGGGLNGAMANDPASGKDSKPVASVAVTMPGKTISSGGNATGTYEDTTLAAGTTLTVGANTTLEVAGTLINEGTVINNGKINVAQGKTVENSGALTNNGALEVKGDLANNGAGTVSLGASSSLIVGETGAVSGKIEAAYGSTVKNNSADNPVTVVDPSGAEIVVVPGQETKIPAPAPAPDPTTTTKANPSTGI